MLPSLVHQFFLRSNLPLHFLNHDRQLFFAFFTGFGIDITGDSLAVGISGRVFALPEVVVELVDTTGACFAVLALVWLEAALIGVLLLFVRRHRCVGLSYLMVDLHRRLLLHGVGHMGVDVQGRCRGDVTDDGRERLDIHSMLQRHGRKGMSQVMEANLFTLGPLQSLLHPAADEVGRQRTILFHRRREHPPGVHRRFVVFQDFQQRTGQDDHPD